MNKLRERGGSGGCLLYWMIYLLFYWVCFICRASYCNYSFFGDKMYALFLADLRIGFISRTFIGSIVTLLFHPVTAQKIDIFIFISQLLMSLLVSLLLAMFTSSSRAKRSFYIVTLLSFLIVTSPSGVLEYERWGSGSLDLYWVIVFFLSFFLLKKRRALWLLPVLCFLGFFIHYGYLLSYLPAVLAAVLYLLLKEGKNKKISALAYTAALVSFASCIYFYVFANKTITMDYDQLVDWLNSRLGMNVETTLITGYTLIYQIKGYGSGFLPLMKALVNYIGSMMSVRDLILLLVRMALFAMIPFVFWLKCLRAALCKKEKFFFAVCILMLTAYFAFCIYSTDADRGTASMLVSHSVLLLYLLDSGNETVTGVVDSISLSEDKVLPVLISTAVFYVIGMIF